MSARSSANASLSRMPVHASSPISVCIVAPRSGGNSVPAAFIIALTCASV
jgi:hypothetical protein